MKKIFVLCMLVLSPFLAANELEPNLTIRDNTVIYDLQDYQKTYKSDVYHFYIRNDINQVGPNQYLVHTMVEYVMIDGMSYADLGYSVKRIFNYGVLDCQLKAFSLTSDIYVDADNKIVYSESYNLGEFVSELMTPDTARNSVYNKVCVNTI